VSFNYGDGVTESSEKDTAQWLRSFGEKELMEMTVGSCDNDSGFVFGMGLNFDKDMDPETAELDAVAVGDPALPYPHRKYARPWAAADYAESLVISKKERVRKATEEHTRKKGKAL